MSLLIKNKPVRDRIVVIMNMLSLQVCLIRLVKVAGIDSSSHRLHANQ